MTRTMISRELTEADPPCILQACAAQGWQKPESQYLRYYQESVAGTRVILVADIAGDFAGYVTVVWRSAYPPFQIEKIPEIVDFNVVMRHRRQGIGSALMDTAEERIARRSAVAGIGVGLTADYGAAQILYVKRGYIPDGRGIVQRGHHLAYGEQAIVDDDLALFFINPVAGLSSRLAIER